MVQLARKLPCVETMLNCGLMRVVIPIGLSFVGNAVNGGVGLHPVARTAWKLPNAATSSSAGCDVRAVGPTMKLALLVPVLVATWSRGVTGSRPENSLALAALSAAGGCWMRMLPPTGRELALCAEQITVRTAAGLLTSASTE